MKIYMRCGFTANEILKNIDLQFDGNKVTFQNGIKSKLDFTKITKEADGLRKWLNVEIHYNESELNLTLG